MQGPITEPEMRRTIRVVAVLEYIGSPEARLSIEQQVAPNILFTYVSDVTDTSTQLIRVELDFNPRWEAILTREENGYVGLDFAYKRRFK